MSKLDTLHKGMVHVNSEDYSKYMIRKAPTHGGYSTVLFNKNDKVVGIQSFDHRGRVIGYCIPSTEIPTLVDTPELERRV